MQLRVRSLDGAELVLDVPHYSVRVQVSEIKRLSLARLLQFRTEEERDKTAGKSDADDEETTQRDPIDMTDDGEPPTRTPTLENKMMTSCLVFRGQLLADADNVNLFAVAPSDFFVLIEDLYDDGDDSTTAAAEDDAMNDPQASEEEETKSEEHGHATVARKRRRTAAAPVPTNDPNPDQQHNRDASVIQLLEMGFDIDQARHALELTNGELPRAVALLMGEAPAVSSTPRESQRSRLRVFVAKMIDQYPELAAIESLLMNEEIHQLKKQTANKSDFEAFVTLKESFPIHWLAQMNENPAATLLFLSAPHHFDSHQGGSKNYSTKRRIRSPRSSDKQEIDLTSDHEDDGDDSEAMSNGVARSSKDEDAINRLTSMGFASDLVAAVYESCGGNEEIAANLLLETVS